MWTQAKKFTIFIHLSRHLLTPNLQLLETTKVKIWEDLVKDYHLPSLLHYIHEPFVLSSAMINHGCKFIFLPNLRIFKWSSSSLSINSNASMYPIRASSVLPPSSCCLKIKEEYLISQIPQALLLVFAFVLRGIV